VRLFGHPERFFDSFTRLAQDVSTCAEHLHTILSDPARTAELVRTMEALYAAAEQGRQEVVDRIDEVTVTPIDREDVYLLASQLGELLGNLVDAARSVQALGLEQSVELVRELSAVLVSAARHVQDSVSQAARPRRLAARSRGIEQLVDEGSAIYDAAVSRLFAGSPDPVEVLRWKAVYDVLQDAIRQCKEVETIVSGIAIENPG